MNFTAAEEVVKATLYEGYLLYPYRPSAIKNRQRWTFGGVYPPACSSSGASRLECQCLLEGSEETRIEVRVRFLQPLARQIGEFPSPLEALPDGVQPEFRAVHSLTVAGRTFYTSEEAVEREVELPGATLRELAANNDAPVTFGFPESRTTQTLIDAGGLIRGLIIRAHSAIEGTVRVKANPVATGAYRLCIRIDNTTPTDSNVLMRHSTSPAAEMNAFLSTHTILGVANGAFVSLIDPPESLAETARTCVNQAAWPVLVGKEGARDLLLCSPIILYDYPQIAPESPGDLFDGTEIDEILTLRILTLTDSEKQEVAANDERVRALLARTEALTPEQLHRLHGVMRSPRASREAPSVATMEPYGGEPEFSRALLEETALGLCVGDRVRLRPKRGGDIIDLALVGETAVIEAIEVDFENRIHVAVALDADPGRDFGLERMPGHRFFFSPEEIETLSSERAP